MFLPSRQIQNMTDEKSDADTDNHPQNFNSKLFYKRPTDLTILSKSSSKNGSSAAKKEVGSDGSGGEGRRERTEGILSSGHGHCSLRKKRGTKE